MPAALTKDKKRIDGQEVQVSPVWQSTLYVTNFPEKFDAADIQQLFEPVSANVRVPACDDDLSLGLLSTAQFSKLAGRVGDSKVLGDSYTYNTLTRYVGLLGKPSSRLPVFIVAQSAAQRALSLHDNVLEEGSGQRLQVRISDPSHRQKRSDANATKRELYVTGLPKQATEADLEKLFGPVRELNTIHRRLGPTVTDTLLPIVRSSPRMPYTEGRGRPLSRCWICRFRD